MKKESTLHQAWALYAMQLRYGIKCRVDLLCCRLHSCNNRRHAKRDFILFDNRQPYFLYVV